MIQNKVYNFQPGKIIINKNGEDNGSLSIDTKKKNKKSSGNHALNTSIQGINKKLELMPYFNGFFVEGPSEFREGEREVKGLKLSEFGRSGCIPKKKQEPCKKLV